MSKILKDVMSKVVKEEKQVELQAEKVELGSVNELKAVLKYTKQKEKDFDKFEQRQLKAYNDFKEASSAILNFGNSMQSELKRVLEDITEFAKKANELGAKPTDFKEYNEALEAYKESLSLAKIAQDLGKVKSPF